MLLALLFILLLLAVLGFFALMLGCNWKTYGKIEWSKIVWNPIANFNCIFSKSGGPSAVTGISYH